MATLAMTSRLCLTTKESSSSGVRRYGSMSVSSTCSTQSMQEIKTRQCVRGNCCSHTSVYAGCHNLLPYTHCRAWQGLQKHCVVIRWSDLQL